MPLNTIHYFFVGDDVEVTNNPPGSYYEATIISLLEDDKYLVEYTELLNEDDDTLFTETVSYNDLRPKPPRVFVPAAAGYSENQKVDAYENEGWWLTSIIRRDSNSNYYFVRCMNGDYEIMVHSSLLRIHHDWIDGSWVVP